MFAINMTNINETSNIKYQTKIDLSVNWFVDAQSKFTILNNKNPNKGVIDKNTTKGPE